jgi:hypothetical protein
MLPPARPPPGSTGTLVIRVEDRLLCAWLGNTNSQKSVYCLHIVAIRVEDHLLCAWLVDTNSQNI